MFIKNKFSHTDDNTIIWRYLTYSKFLDLLETSSLYFSRIDCFDDKHEATQPLGAINFAAVTENPWQVFTYQCVEKQLEIIKNMTFACCWHINTQEDLDMWKRYASKHGNEGVAIQTTFQRLSECFETERVLTNLKMKYINFSSYFLDYSYPYYPEFFTIKDKKYEFENEMRIITLEHDYPEYDPDSEDMAETPKTDAHTGEHIKVNLNHLIQSIYLCPNSTERFQLLIEELLKKYHVHSPIIMSKYKNV